MNVASENCRIVYGGVLFDGGLVAHDLAAVHSLKFDQGGDEIPFGLGLAAIPDLPLSLIGDTLTLPITIPLLIKWLNTDEKERKDSAPHYIASP